jgi:hypothetical protein
MLFKIKDNWDLISIVIIISLILILFNKCNNKIKQTESIVITNYKDTIYPKDTIYVPEIKEIPYPVYIDTNTYIPKSIDSLEINRFFFYKDTIKDSNIEIYRNIHTQGKTLVFNKLEYKLKVPLIIKDCTIVKKDSLIYKLPKYQFNIGMFTNFKSITPMLELSVNNNSYMLGYDLLNKYPTLGFKYRIYKSKK